VIGPEIDSVKEGDALPLAIVIEASGRKMQADFEPVLERQIHTLINEAQGIWHMGQRDIIWLRIGKDAQKAGFKIEHFGSILHAVYHEQYSSILDKVQIKIYTEEAKVKELLAQAKESYASRDSRLADMSDESVDTFYSCSLCQSFAPDHICIITPERSGLCGAYSWLDGKAAYEITPTGANQPIAKGATIDAVTGKWEKVDEFISSTTHGAVESMSAYSMIVDPMTSCGCFECISAVLPSTNGIMIVDREYGDMTPSGMKFSTLAGTVGGGNQMPGFIGHSKQYIGSKKFISAEGGVKRIVWMPSALKQEMKETLIKSAEEAGLNGEEFFSQIADENVGADEEQIVEFISGNGHPAMEMDEMF